MGDIGFIFTTLEGSDVRKTSRVLFCLVGKFTFCTKLLLLQIATEKWNRLSPEISDRLIHVKTIGKGLDNHDSRLKWNAAKRY